MKQCVYFLFLAVGLVACGASQGAPPSTPTAVGEVGGGESPAATAGEGDACGGEATIACADGLVCDLNEADGQGCNAENRSGRCVPKPEMCAEIFDPVCGCDGKTYPNDCHRLMAGVARDRKGACDE